MIPQVQCPNCNARLPEDFFNKPQLMPCPSCSVQLGAEIFPSLFRRINPGQSAEIIMIEGESSCFFHPQKKAVVPCDNCGRFLCALCDCELNGQHLCPTCLESGKTKGKIKNLENHRTLYENIALTVAIVPVVLCYFFTFITAPMALFIAIRYWKSPPSLVRGNKFRFVMAIIVALLLLSGWAAVLIFSPFRQFLSHG